jgi:hypothetical protein
VLLCLQGAGIGFIERKQPASLYFGPDQKGKDKIML